MNQEQIEFCKRHNLNENQFFGNEKILGDLDLRSLTSIPKGFNPTVGGDLDLSSLTSIPKGFNPTVGGYLDLRSLTSIPKGFNPTVGGDLYLRSLTSIPKGFNPTVGGDLYLRSGLKAEFRKMQNVHEFRNSLSWRKGKFIKVDGILCEVLIKRGNVYKIKIAGKRIASYLVTNGTNAWAHGPTLKKAQEDLHFKLISEKLKKDPIKKDTMISMPYYRIVTGACEQGCQSWMKQNNIPDKPIRADELLPLLEKTNAYGLNQFKKLITF